MQNSNNDKYFVPNIEDIRVGYECEVQELENFTTNITSDIVDINSTYSEKWTPKVVGIYTSGDIDVPNMKHIRVSYLTKEQIEAEGWKFTGKSLDLWFEKEGTFEIGTWTSYKVVMHYGAKDNIGINDCRLFIYAEDQNVQHMLYEGECKDINDFRWICKKLKI